MSDVQGRTTGKNDATANPDQAALALKSKVIDGAHELTDELTHLASDVAGQAKKTAESSLSGGQKRAAESLGTVANAIRKTGEQLRAEDQGALTEYLDQAAQKVDAASEYLQRRSLGQVVGDLEQFARREPALFLGGAFVAGLVGGRFLKASRPTPSSRGGVGQNGQRNGAQRNGHADERQKQSPQTKPTTSNDSSTKAPGTK